MLLPLTHTRTHSNLVHTHWGHTHTQTAALANKGATRQLPRTTLKPPHSCVPPTRLNVIPSPHERNNRIALVMLMSIGRKDYCKVSLIGGQSCLGRSIHLEGNLIRLLSIYFDLSVIYRSLFSNQYQL